MIGGECELISSDIADKSFSKRIVDLTLQRFGKIDILVNNAGVQYQQNDLECISYEQFDRTMKVNIFGIINYKFIFCNNLLWRNTIN